MSGAQDLGAQRGRLMPSGELRGLGQGVACQERLPAARCNYLRRSLEIVILLAVELCHNPLSVALGGQRCACQELTARTAWMHPPHPGGVIYIQQHSQIGHLGQQIKNGLNKNKNKKTTQNLNNIHNILYFPK